VIIVASVSCIYGLGSPEDYRSMLLELETGHGHRDERLEQLVAMQYQRNDIEPASGTFRVRGDILDIFPLVPQGRPARIEFFGDEIESPSTATIPSPAVPSRSHDLRPGLAGQALRDCQRSSDRQLARVASAPNSRSALA
jgi:hypothetical protein